MSTTRRDLLKMTVTAGGALGLGLAAPSVLRGQEPAAPPPPPVPVAPLEGVAKAARPLKILILGGTGFTGPHQVRYALARGHELTLFNRGRRPKEWPAEVEELTGDRNTGDLAALADRTWDVCIDNPTTLPFWVRDAGKLLAGKVGQYVFISTLSAYASNAEPGMGEDAPTAVYEGEDVMAETLDTLRESQFALYGPLKAASEREAEKQFPGITTVIRPGLIVGPGDETDRYTYWPVRLDRGGEVVAPGDGSDPVQVIDARDLAEWTIRMVEDRTFGAFNAVGPGYRVTMADLLCGIRAATTAGAELTWIPTAFLEEQGAQPWSDLPVWVPSGPETAGFGTRSNARAIAAGLTFRPLAQTALETLAWWKTLPADRQATLRAGLSPERERELLAAWKAKQAKEAKEAEAA
jgi:2'-hydroxyisoflavone reductase